MRFMCPRKHAHTVVAHDDSSMQAELADGEEVAHCPSCTLTIQVIYDPADFQPGPNAPEPPASTAVAPVGV
jgi:hypothetical protein